MEEQKLYDEYLEGRHWENHSTIYAERFADFLKKYNFNGLLVDAGCGNGRDVNVFQQREFNVLGIDCSEEEINNARLKHPDCRFEIQDLQALGFRNNSIGAYFMINVIHYVRKQETLNELRRTLEPSGFLYVHFNVDIVDGSGNQDYYHDENNIVDLISNFQIIEQRKFKRVDTIPKKHTHTILELILQK